MLLSSIYGLANEKCKDFKATVARIAYIERMSNEMADQCGSRPRDDVLRHPAPKYGPIVYLGIVTLSH